MKYCGGCASQKAISDFWKGQTQCKDCLKEWKRQNRDKQRGYLRKWKRSHTAQRAESRRVNADKNRSYALVYKAVKTGRLTKLPCEVCGSTEVEAHHHAGYDKANRINVKWLCKKHHEGAHHIE